VLPAPGLSVRLSGKVALVTGGAAGLGLAYARRLLAEGAKVMIADIVDTADALKRLNAPDTLHAVRADVSVFADCERMVAEAQRRFGRLDVLVSNAAVFATLKPGPFEAIAEAEWDRVMAVNVKGIWNCARAVAPLMRAQGGGRIINVASAIAQKGTAGLLHYVTSKGAVIAMTRALARELGPDGITVNALAPGLTLSETVLANRDITAFQREAVLASRALKREAVADDLEGTVVFLASEDSAFMTGQTLIVDGGSVFL
jgi:NAD(P)-dependent dehydrogenase (short-subunit alcohol dehydrogenase family)